MIVKYCAQLHLFNSKIHSKPAKVMFFLSLSVAYKIEFYKKVNPLNCLRIKGLFVDNTVDGQGQKCK